MCTRTRLLTIAIMSIASTGLMARPANAGGIVEDVLAGVRNIVQGIVNQATNAANAARAKAQEATDRATEARNGVEEILDKVHEGLEALNEQVLMKVGEAVEDVKMVLAHELQGRDEFLGETGCSPELCEPFREDLISLLENVETISNCVFVITEQEEINIDLSREIDIVEQLPGRILFPLYRVLGVDSKVFESGLIGELNDLAANLLVLKQFVIESACDPVWEDPQRATTIVRRVTTAASALKLIGKGMISVGETEIFGDAGIHGYIHVNVNFAVLKTWGERLLGLGEAIVPIVEFAGRKVDYCINLHKQEQDHAAVTGMQNEILAAIKAIQVPAGGGADLDHDGDIDLADYSMFQNAFSFVAGPGS